MQVATEKAISELEYFLSRARVKLFGVDGLVTEALRILAGESRAMADVRTLDEWHTARRGRSVRVFRDDENRQGIILIEDYASVFTHVGATPDEARAKAAAWVREQAKGAPPEPSPDPGVNWDRGNLGH